mgnify:CR=1 FL=1
MIENDSVRLTRTARHRHGITSLAMQGEQARIMAIDANTGMVTLDQPVGDRTQWHINALAPADMPTTLNELVEETTGNYLDEDQEAQLIERLRQVVTPDLTDHLGGLLDDINTIIDGHGVEHWEPTDGITVPEGAVVTGDEERIYPDDAGFSYVNVGDLYSATLCEPDRGGLYLTDMETMAEMLAHQALMEYAEDQQLSDLMDRPAPSNLVNVHTLLDDQAERMHEYRVTCREVGPDTEAANRDAKVMYLAADHIHDARNQAVRTLLDEAGHRYAQLAVEIVEVEYPDTDSEHEIGEPGRFWKTVGNPAAQDMEPDEDTSSTATPSL